MVRWEIAKWFCFHQAIYLCVYSIVSIIAIILILSIDSRDSTWCFVLLSFRWNYSIANHCSDAPRRELAREPLPTNRAKAPVQTSARNRASLLPPTDAIMSSGRLEQLNMLNMIRMKSAICLRMRNPSGERASAATVRWSDSRASAWTKRYRQIQTDMHTFDCAYVHVCRFKIQANTSRYAPYFRCISARICMYLVEYFKDTCTYAPDTAPMKTKYIHTCTYM